METIIHYDNLGRGKWSGDIKHKSDTAPTPDDIAEWAQEDSKKHLLPHYPDTDYDSARNKGEIRAGMRIVGTFRVVK